ncbi:MAG TPA: 3-dehydroquinate synthase [Gammaproteobacteria bacterium]|mgnify:CR=1 FL=1|nr:3-dehydroquinate synthase [Gammaproteobacteria bacterium]|tara:strand:- start:1633 stop:2721 length:1089 start_codon:yes stop_codon:yes gene_type:complete
MIKIEVDLGDRSYPIHIGSGTLDNISTITKIESRQIMVVTNETVAPIYLEQITNSFADQFVKTVILPDGEEFKTLDHLNVIISALLKYEFDRSCTLVALGGGVVGDLTGFAAACYQRGVDYIQIPTTLLSQVDSSVGGKTAVNHKLGKNMIGAFHQPICVVADTTTLSTLDQRQLRAGVAEIIKYGLISDPEFFEWLETEVENLLRLDAECLAYAIRRSCENKAAIVAKDERESGVRALLNLGHTFGHGIENVLGYGKWLHGEAIARGICMAADLSVRMNLLSIVDYERILSLIGRAELAPRLPSELKPEDLVNAMYKDKKNRGRRIRLVLLRGIGHAFVCDDYPDSEFQAVLTCDRAINEK